MNFGILAHKNYSILMQNRKKIFVTNDDGIHAHGLQVLIEEMKKLGDVLCIAPERTQSGMSHAITFSNPVSLEQHRDEPGIKSYSLTGTPVDCIKIALDRFYTNEKPDLIVSGINHGSNSSICAIYSGTVAAAREGGINNIPSIAFSSVNFEKNADFTHYSPYVYSISEKIITQGIPEYVFLNVNFPHTKNIKGTRVSHQAKGVWIERFERRTDPHDREYFWLTGNFKNFEPEAEDSDEWLLKEGFATITPLKIEKTDTESISKLSFLNS
ncbi:MAG: 5'/3'-nucleotidase SurE [Bacteroidales bacterium]|jgi:5'-nucleotidase|nr:5'/3'-nucleotidase SurE [Bacteroidales bacterium]